MSFKQANTNLIKRILNDNALLGQEILGPMQDMIVRRYNNGMLLPAFVVKRKMKYSRSNVYPDRKDIRRTLEGGLTDEQSARLNLLKEQGVEYVYLAVIDENIAEENESLKDYRCRLVVVKNEPIALMWALDMFMTALDVYDGDAYDLYHKGSYYQKGKNKDVLVMVQIRFDPSEAMVEFEHTAVYKDFKGNHFMADEIFPRQFQALSRYFGGWRIGSLIASSTILKHICQRYFPGSAGLTGTDRESAIGPGWGVAKWWEDTIPENWLRSNLLAEPATTKSTYQSLTDIGIFDGTNLKRLLELGMEAIAVSEERRGYLAKIEAGRSTRLTAERRVLVRINTAA